MPFAKNDPNINRKGRPNGALEKRCKLEELLTAEVIDDTLKKDFISGDRFTRQLVYEHYYGKPVQKTENDNTHNFPSSININLIKGK